MKASVTFIDDPSDGGFFVGVEFDPPLVDGVEPTPAQQAAAEFYCDIMGDDEPEDAEPERKRMH